MVLFNEANLVNLLETVLYSSDACCELDDGILDLTDYCVRHLSNLVADIQNPEESKPDSLTAGDLSQQLVDWKPGMELPNLPIEDVLDEIKRHQREISFQIAMKSITILRYLSDYVDDLPLGVSTRLVITHDVPVLLVQLLELQPWIKQQQVFEGSSWIQNTSSIPKIEIQIWLTIYNVLSRKICTEKYQINSYRKGVLTKLINMMSSDHLAQLPMLPAFKKWLLQLSIANHAPQSQMKANFMIEAVAQLRDEMIQK